jgi:PHD/YefM family antitoxin component YafN of YafNO toxin-antitoxin module
MKSATLDISEARRQFTKLDERLEDERIIWVTRHNKRAFAVVNLDVLEALLETLEILQDGDALKMLQESLADIQAGRLHDHDDIKREMLSDETPRQRPVDKNRKRRPRSPSA